MLHVPSVLLTLVPHLPSAQCAFVFHVPCILRALVPYMSRGLCSLVPHVPRSSTALRDSCHMCSCVSNSIPALVPHVYFALLVSGCLCFKLYVLLCSLFLTCFRYFKPNMLLCISCLVAFMPCTSCSIGALGI